MRKLSALPLLVVAALCCGPLLAVAHASAASDRIINDCETSPTGALRGTYAKSDLRYAMSHLPANISEYSGCYDAINAALLEAQNGNGSGGHHGGDSGTGRGGSGGGTGAGGTGGTGGMGAGATGDGAGGGENAGTDGAGGATGGAPAHHSGTNAPVQLANLAVRPGVLPRIGGDGHTLPTPLIVFLVLLGAGTLTVAGTSIGRRVFARRGT